MLSKKIAEQILSIGCEYDPPKGGVAQVLCNYKQYVYPQFKFVANSGGCNLFYKLFRLVFAIFRVMYFLIFDRKIRIVHIHTASYNSFKRSAIFVCLTKLFGKKVILHIHGGGFKNYYMTDSKWISSILDKCDVIIALSNTWKQYYHTITACSRILVLENIVPEPVSVKHHTDVNCIHFLFLGLIDKQKGIFDLLDVLCEHRSYLQGKILLHIAGNGNVSKLNEWISKYKLEDLVKYEGWVSGKKKEDLFSKSDIFILPSYIEGLPVSILEAMSYKMPILSTTVGAIPELVIDGENGFLFHPGDKKALFSLIIRFTEDKSLFSNMGDNAFKVVASYFPKNVAYKLDQIYKSVLNIDEPR